MRLEVVKRTDPRLLANMAVHYSHPKGFVGRNICYAVLHDGIYYGGIVAGSATRFLPGRGSVSLNNWVNNIFFHIEPFHGSYPYRNFAQSVLKTFRNVAAKDWHDKYGDSVHGFETLVEIPRTGEVYRRDGWVQVGVTKGYTCKREGGKGTDAWSGKRVWDTQNLRPKLVFIRPLVSHAHTEP